MSKGIWKDYFSFSKKERIAVIILLALIIVFVILPYFFSPQFKKPVVDEQFQKQLASLKDSSFNDDKNKALQSKAPVKDTIIKDIITEKHLFYFDPNTLDEEGWRKLGIRDKTIQTIINYRNKGGYFKKPDDIRKIYGLKKEEADELIPYIQIKSEVAAGKQNQKDEEGNDKDVSEKKQEIMTVSNIKKIDINTATAEDFKSLPGIGDVLANRMVKFRNAIHGFKSVQDIKKTYGLSDSTYQHILPYLTISDTLPKN